MQTKQVGKKARSVKQLAQQNNIAHAAQLWRKLSDADRLKWKEAMISNPLPSLSGKGTIKNPFHYFIAQQFPNAGQNSVSSMQFKGYSQVPRYTGCTVTIIRSANRGNILVKQSPNGIVADAKIYFAFNLPAGQKHFPSHLPNIGEISVLDSTDRQFSNNFSAQYHGLPRVGSLVFWRVILRLRPNGYRAASFEGSYIQPNN